MRGFLLLVIAIGIVTSFLGNRPSSHGPSPEARDAFSAAAAEQNDEAALARSGEISEGEGGSLDIQRSSDGHFYADVDVNGAKLHMLVDTGATSIALSRDDARSAGIATSIGMNDVVGEGADGSIHGEYVEVDRMSLGNATAERMPAVVLNSGSQSLLGQSFLAKFASVEIRGDTMTLR